MFRFGRGTIQVTGSVSGTHSGMVTAHSDGDGASFLPSSKFTPGEVVTVSAPALNIEGSGNNSYTFKIAHPAPGIGTWRWPGAGRVSGDVWRFRSYSYIAPQAVKILELVRNVK